MVNEYDWPTASEWDSLSPAERVTRAKELVALADERRDPNYRGPLTMAQEHARSLLESARQSLSLWADA